MNLSLVEVHKKIYKTLDPKLKHLQEMIDHLNVPKHKSHQDQDKWTLIPLDHFINLQNICQNQDHMLTQSKMGIEQQANLIEKIQIRNMPVMHY